MSGKRLAGWLLATGLMASMGAPGLAETVPVRFVGCPSDGQQGPRPAPHAPTHRPRVPAAMAARLAWYESEDLGVLAPRGWRCVGLAGSNGSFLMVSPESHDRDALDAKLKGPAIQLSVSFGGTSGRFEAAKLAARLFPSRRAFVEGVIAEGFEAKEDFPFGPFPHDRVRRIGPNVVAFETPANQEGVGTMSRLVRSSAPILGRVAMNADNDAILLAVRLDPGMGDVATAILRQFDDDAAKK